LSQRTGGYTSVPHPHKEEASVRAFDCSHETHEDVHFTAETDEDLVQQIRQHRDQYHREISDEQIREMVTVGAYEEETSAQ
jgi:hypothetical protein